MASDGDRPLDRHPSNMHTMVLGGCTKYFQWLSMGMYYSHEKSGQPGPITRILCCSDEERDSVPQVRSRCRPISSDAPLSFVGSISVWGEVCSRAPSPTSMHMLLSAVVAGPWSDIHCKEYGQKSTQQ